MTGWFLKRFALDPWTLGRSIALSAFWGFFDNRLSTAAAAMAFYTMFALGPILILAIAIAEPFVGRLMAEETILGAMSTIIDPSQLALVKKFASEDLFQGGGVAAVIGTGVLLYTATRVFVELDAGIYAIWHGKEVHDVHPVLIGIRSRLLALLLIVILGVILIAVILVTVVLSGYSSALEKFPVLGVWIGPAISEGVRYGVVVVFFSIIYKFLPDVQVPWKFAFIGGAVNALLFAAGNRALVYYFEVTQLSSAFGATAGLAAIMVWMYWTSLTILMGAQIGRSTRDAIETSRTLHRQMIEQDIQTG
jgi:membrane protein